jgi:hypothetical protein
MPSEVICPTCGRSLLIGPREEPAPNGSPIGQQTIEVVLPCTTSGSSEDLQVPPIAMVAPEPDPVLDALTARPAEFGGAEGGPELAEGPLGRNPIATFVFEEAAAPDAMEPALAVADEQEGEDEAEPPERSWSLVLLRSYASAMTLACLWLLYEGRWRHTPSAPVEETIPADSRLEHGLRASRSERVEPPKPVAADRITTLGQPIRIGMLELTPIEVWSGRVVLERATSAGRRQRREGGRGAIVVRLRLRNLSEDTVFAPLDEAFLREPDHGLPRSFLETGRGERIDLFPLAIESEWSIVGQSFRDLRPGEVREVVIPSAPETLGLVADPMTWRLTVRSGLDQIDEVGIRFLSREIQEPAPEVREKVQRARPGPESDTGAARPVAPEPYSKDF